MGDNKTPYTNDWNIGVAEQLSWRSVLEITYVGNHSGNELINGGNGKLSDFNSNSQELTGCRIRSKRSTAEHGGCFYVELAMRQNRH